MNDDDDVAPRWLAWSWELSQKLAKAVKAGHVIRLTTTRVVRRPVIDRIVWGRGRLIEDLTSEAFSVGFPSNCAIPDGWRFAFVQPINHKDLVTLADCKWSHLLKLQILSVDADTIKPDDKQVVFNPVTAKVVKEFALSY